MAVIDIRRRHGMDLPSARAAVERVASGLAERHGLAWQWHGDRLEFQRSGAEGSISVEPDELHVHIRLGFPASLLTTSIQDEIERRFANLA
ncbi:MAG: polyhydroxyalkanoic acid system family protein [Xanthomonadales bacterium]|nr:polyhydroxyalkanoic acid system family protein [Xanthomonadales bacterium]